MTAFHKQYLRISNIILTFIAFLFTQATLFAQIPKGVPHPDQNEPVNTTTEVLFYFVIPIVLIIIYFIWRRQVKKRTQQKKKEREDRDMEDNPEK